MYRRLDKLARKASTITESIVKPAFKHLEWKWIESMLEQVEEKQQTNQIFQFVQLYMCTRNKEVYTEVQEQTV